MGNIALTGTVLWDQAAALRESLVQELGKKDKIILDFTALERTDTGIVQVLLSWEDACRRQNRTLELRGPMKQEVKDLLKDLGIAPQALGEWVS